MAIASWAHSCELSHWSAWIAKRRRSGDAMDAMDASRYSEGLPRVEVDRRDWEFVRRDVLSDPFSIFFPPWIWGSGLGPIAGFLKHI